MTNDRRSIVCRFATLYNKNAYINRRFCNLNGLCVRIKRARYDS